MAWEAALELWQLVLPFLVATSVSAVSTPLVSRIARQIGAVDSPNDRKVRRREDMPLMGGWAVAVGCWVGVSTRWTRGRIRRGCGGRHG